MTEPKWLTIPQATKYTTLGRTTIYKLISTGHLKATKVNRRTLIAIADIDQLLAEGCVHVS